MGTKSLLLSTVMVGVLGGAVPAGALTSCDLRFDLEGWSVFYKEATGRGVVRCDNGQSARVRLETRGGGVTFGRSRIVGGSGDFSPVADINEVFGSYGSAEAHAGMGASSAAQVVTKGPVSLAFSGTGTGVDIGFAFGRFRILPSGHRRHAEEDVRDEPRRRSSRPPDDAY